MAALTNQLALLLLPLQPFFIACGKFGFVDLASAEPEHFFAGIAQAPAGRRIGIENTAFQVVNEDAVFDAVEEGSSLAVSRSIVVTRLGRPFQGRRLLKSLGDLT